MELEQLLPPPDAVHVDRDWSQVARDLGVEFGADYRVVLDRYGQGHFDDGTMLFDPRRRGFELEIQEVLEILSDPDLRYPGKELPYPPHPGPGTRMLPVGANGSGGYLFTMVTDGVQDEARYWLGDLDVDDFTEVPGPISTVLVGLLTAPDRPSRAWRMLGPNALADPNAFTRSSHRCRRHRVMPPISRAYLRGAVPSRCRYLQSAPGCGR